MREIKPKHVILRFFLRNLKMKIFSTNFLTVENNNVIYNRR